MWVWIFMIWLAVTWRMLSLETTNKRPIWLSLEQCQGMFLDPCSWLICCCSSFKRVYKELYAFSTSQVAVPLAAEHLQCGAADWVLCGARQPCNGHRKQHQVFGGLSDHPCPSTRFEFYTLKHHHNPHTLYVKLVFVSVLTGLLCSDLVFIEACLRCLRTVFISPVTPVQLLYTVGYLPVTLTGCDVKQPSLVINSAMGSCFVTTSHCLTFS